MSNVIVDMRNFVNNFFPESLTYGLNEDQLAFRMSLLEEEFGETLGAYEGGDAEELVDGLIDIVVIAIGTLIMSGVNPEKAWLEVYRANMSKARGIKTGRDNEFDVYKPEGWEPPDHSDNHGDLDKLLGGPEAD